MIEQWYKIHDIMKIHMRGEFAHADFIDSQLAFFRSGPIDPSQLDLEFLDTIEHKDNSDILQTELFSYKWNDRMIWDSISTVQSEQSGKISVYSDRGLDHYIMMELVQLQLLRKGFTFSHAAGFVTDGTAVIFPSWPGTGKTSLFVYMAHQDGVDILGDQDLIISRNGDVYSFPVPLTLSHYHANEQLPRVKEAFKKKKRGFSGTILSTIYNWFGRVVVPVLDNLSPKLLGAVRRYAPSPQVIMPLEELVPVTRIPAKAPLRKVVSLIRWSGESFKMEQCDAGKIIPEMISMRSSDSMVFSRRLERLHLYCLGLSAFGAMESQRWFANTEVQILTEALQGVECYQMRIPAKAQIAELGKIAKEIIEC